MKRGVLVVLVAVSVQGTLVAQDLVSVITDSAQQQVEWIRDVAEHVESVGKTVEQISRINRMIQYQAMAIETMSEGDWKSFVEGYQYQAAAMATMSDAVLNVGDGAFADLTGTAELAASDEFMEFGHATDSLATAASAQATLLRQTDMALMATQRNMETVRRAVDGGVGEQSFTDKLQRNNMVLQGVSNQLGIVSQQLGATARAEETRIYEKLIREQATKQYIEGWYASNVQYDNRYTEAQVQSYMDGSAMTDKLDSSGAGGRIY